MRRATVALLIALGCRQEAPPPAPTPPRPDSGPTAPATLTDAERAEAETAVAAACTGCHTGQMLAQQRLSAKQWEAVIKKMQGWGSPLDPAHAPRAARVLAERYPVEGPAYQPPAVEAAPALATLEPLPDGKLGGGDATAGKQVYARSCAPCHGPDARGGPLGVNLVDRPLLWRADDLLALVQRGRGRMPGFPLAERDVASVIAYLRSVR